MHVCPEVRTADHLVRSRVDLHPDATAIECGDQSLTYRDLWQRAGGVAARLRRTAGFEPGCLIGVLHPRGTAGVVAQLAAWRAGAACLPLDPALPDGRIASVLADAGPVAVLVDPALRNRLPESVTVADGTETVEGVAEEPAQVPSPLAYVIYTSGSSGTPKGVEVGHPSLVNLLRWHRETYGTGPGTRVAAFAGLGFDASVWEIWAPLAAGATLVLPAEPVGADITAVSAFLETKNIEQCFLSTPLAEQLLRSLTPPGTLRVLLTGGDRLRVRPPASFPAAVHNHYGPTEATVVTTASRDLRGAGGPGRPPVIGTPIPGALVRLVDAEGEDVTEPGTAGELLIGGEVLASGYRHDPALTREKFAGSEGADRWYASGHVCRWTDSGELEFVERRDGQWSVRGSRVEPAEIEHAMLAVPEVTQSAVVLVDDGAGGSLVAFYCGTAGIRAVRGALTEQLPRYMVPSRLEVLDALPLTPNGKIDRKALLALAKEPVARPEGPEEPEGPKGTEAAEGAEAAEESVPAGSAEEGIAEIWAALLVGTEPRSGDNFFEIGGHSILAARMIGTVRNRFGVKIGLQAVFDHPVLADLAARVDELSRNGS